MRTLTHLVYERWNGTRVTLNDHQVPRSVGKSIVRKRRKHLSEGGDAYKHKPSRSTNNEKIFMYSFEIREPILNRM